MATYNNKHWLLSHIRNSFISTDDTGMCEAIMLSEDLPNQYALLQRTFVNNSQKELIRTISASADDYCCYPGLDQSDDEDAMDPLNQSYDIQMDQGISFIQRSNTAQKLDKMNLARKRASKIKNVKCEDPIVMPSDTDTSALFVKKIVCKKIGDTMKPSQLAEQLTKYPKQPQNRYLPYSRFDGTAQTSIQTKKIKIFLTMLPENHRNYPMQMCVLGNAKIQDFIGLICYKISVAYPDVQLLSERSYGLYITEEDGEIDMDFPPLDLREPCSKFCFSHLALVERKASDVRAGSGGDSRAMSFTSAIESVQDAMLHETTVNNIQQSEDLARMLGHALMMEAPLYRSYRLQILTKGIFKTDIQLGISAEKLEIDPVQKQNSKFWVYQHAISHSMDSVVWCEVTAEPSANRSIVRIVYSHSPVNDLIGQQTGSPSSAATVSNSVGDFRNYHFITDPACAEEIVEKVRNIIEVRSSPARRDYLCRRSSVHTVDKRKKPFKKKSILFK